MLHDACCAVLCCGGLDGEYELEDMLDTVSGYHQYYLAGNADQTVSSPKGNQSEPRQMPFVCEHIEKNQPIDKRKMQSKS